MPLHPWKHDSSLEPHVTVHKSTIARPAALVFDMDGVLIDSNPFHLQKWIDLLDEHGIPYSPEDLPRQILGHRNDHTFRFFFGAHLSETECRNLSEELEARFRRVFRPHARSLPGLRALVTAAARADIPMAVASSAMAKNVEFAIDALGFRPYFRVVVNGDEVSRPKPDPEIYLKAAQKLECDPAGCVAFEDSFPGIEAAKNAGMKCVAIASTFPLEQLQATGADLALSSFEQIDLGRLRELFQEESL